MNGTTDIPLPTNTKATERHSEVHSLPEREFLALTGFAGESQLSGYLRLYTSPDLTEGLEVPERLIRKRDLAKGDCRFELQTIWLNNDAEIRPISVDALEAEADFLNGDMVGEMLPEVTRAGGNLDVPAGIVTGPVCTIIASLATVSMAFCTKVCRRKGS